ncbi:hypothetical protein BM1374166_02184 [Bartonella tribocorum]|nr:hypothetical protein BM1374166_02184 [Bartonella tribocorum]
MILITDALNPQNKITKISHPKAENICTEIELFSTIKT